jgi:hypothetical protein
VDIACDAARSARKAYLSLRRGYRFVPKHIFGVPTDVLINGMADPPPGVPITLDPTVMLDRLNGDGKGSVLLRRLRERTPVSWPSPSEAE